MTRNDSIDLAIEAFKDNRFGEGLTQIRQFEKQYGRLTRFERLLVTLYVPPEEDIEL